MKVKLSVSKKIGNKTFPPGSVVDLFESEVEAIISAGEGCAVADGTMARMVAYDNTGCVPTPQMAQAKQEAPKPETETKNKLK